LPVFRSDKVFGIARGVRAFLNPEGAARGEDPEPQAENPKDIRRRISERRRRLRSEIKSKKRELARVKEAHPAENEAELIERRRRKKRVQQQIFELERQFHAAKGGADGEEPVTGALPDFVVIGVQKGGTTFLYHLLTQHPYVEPPAKKELHFFDLFFEEGIGWYRRCFPAPRWEDGRRTITGEASPYMAHLHAPERMAQVVPEARLIALLRNPVERAYSDYQMVARKDREHKTFEEAIGLEDPAETGKAPPKEGETPEAEDLAVLNEGSEYLSRGVYIDQLLRWTRFFDKEQILVLKSEEFFESPKESLQVVLKFLDLPEWEPASEKLVAGKRNEGRYDQEMDPATRRRLEEYFEPHNRRLYDFLGADFGW
jgi:Sulfotransferase domain